MANIIAEVAAGHEGDVDKALELARLAIDSHCDIIKFQFYKADEICEIDHPDYNTFKSLEFAFNDWNEIFKLCRKSTVKIFADVFGDTSFLEAHQLGVDGFKVHSSDLENYSLLKKVGETGRTILLGIGGRKRCEVYSSIVFLKSNFKNLKIVLMPGHQLFPTPLSEHNLNEIQWFSKAYQDLNIVVGCADHIDGGLPEAIYWPLAAVGAGAKYIEKHITINRDLKLEDYESALNPKDFLALTKMIKKIIPSCSPYPLWTKGREIYRKKTVTTPITKEEVKENIPLKENDITCVRLKNFMDPIMYKDLLGKKLKRNISKGIVLNGLNTDMKVGILVNARSASTRLPNKALMKMAGKETILLLLERMKYSSLASKIVFCTTVEKSDDRLAALVEKCGYEVFRGPNHEVALRLLQAAKLYHFDHIVRVTGDDLLRDIDLIDKSIHSHLEKNADYTNTKGMVYGCTSEIVSMRALKTVVERAVVPKNSEHLSWYLGDESAFVQNTLEVSALFNRPYRLTLDTQKDFELLSKIYNKFYSPTRPIDLKDVIKFLDNNLELTELFDIASLEETKKKLNVRMNV